MHDLRQFCRARADPVLLNTAHEPVWLSLKVGWPIGHHTATHAPLLRREHERPPCLRRHSQRAGVLRLLKSPNLAGAPCWPSFAPQGCLPRSEGGRQAAGVVLFTEVVAFASQKVSVKSYPVSENGAQVLDEARRVAIARATVGSIGCSSSQLRLAPCAPSSHDAKPPTPPSSHVETTGRVPPSRRAAGTVSHSRRRHNKPRR